ncbi:MAG: inorganic phosphate transporter [Acidobacteria bacterium]|nr:inorganic phosphate transporter [Acidobacteriota bacterium]
MLIVLLLLATCFLAYANGANDNFKGVASLYGSRTAGYGTALVWATVATFAGSIVSLVLAQALVVRFSGGGIVPDEIVGSTPLLLAIALGTGLTIIVATFAGLPVSTTHGLTGAIAGSSLMAAGADVNVRPLVEGFLLPLLVSPLLAIALAGALVTGLRHLRVRCGITKEWCVCVGERRQVVPIPQPVSMTAWNRPAPVLLDVAAGEVQSCEERYAGTFLGVRVQALVDAAHVLSAGVVSFARGVNDTPKIAALLLTVAAFDVRGGALVVASAMALGGLLQARKVAETMSHRITPMSHGQGFAANLSTGILVLLASMNGLPVSTTHVSVGSLVGIGVAARSANVPVVGAIAASWLLTLPCGALLGGLAYWTIAVAM